jgi:hypothetical protein
LTLLPEAISTRRGPALSLRQPFHAKKRAMARPRIDTGKSSETVRYAALAAGEAKKKTRHQRTV